MKKLDFCKTKIECKDIVNEMILKVVPEENIVKERYSLFQQLFNSVPFRIG